MEAGRRAEEGPGEDGFSSRLLEDVKQRLRQAFQRARRASPPRRARPVASRGAGGRRAAAAQDELRRAHVEGAIAWLRVELVSEENTKEESISSESMHATTPALQSVQIQKDLEYLLLSCGHCSSFSVVCKFDQQTVHPFFHVINEKIKQDLLEMKSQNRKLAKTLLDLSVEIQRLRNETDMSAALESKPSIMASPE
ncbi:Alanine and arginine-rich domain-containing protein [Varanus komodoensis]|nr:Alanine and arginine-rich domain-containing protein [Varanus komodoensis]